jgi:hypothetical protein
MSENLTPANVVTFDGREWLIEEATLDSAVFNDFTKGEQTIAVRLVLSRQPKPGEMKVI